MSSLEALISPYVGIVRWVDDELAAPADARLHRVVCEAVTSRAGESSVHHAGGCGPVRQAARAAALGEAAERHALLLHRGEILTAATDLPTAVAPGRFALFAAAQHAAPGFPFAPFGDDTVVSWTPAWALPDGRPAHVPTQLVRLGEPEPDETPIAYATSSGAACATTFSGAALRGLLELVERDAFMLTWKNRLSLPLLDWSTDPALAAVDRRCFEPTRLRHSAVDLSAFSGVPTVLGVVRGPRDEAPLGVGAASAATVGEAWLKALSEAFSVRTGAAVMRATEPPRTFRPDWSDVRTFEDHVRVYAADEHLPLAAFLDASPDRRPASALAPLGGRSAWELVAEICDRLERAGATAYAVDVTPPDLAQAGLHVAKVLSPELCALDAPHAQRFLGGSRLRLASMQLGLAQERFEHETLNHDPHPFP